ncbi:MAG: beta-ketoacyl-ACP synthase II [Chitinivibrionales bacterium]|nr:beta-ketoacyl-ACP synthase II [Chitinivibrionales bacterium]MBD3395326.1 beta-ketoacyl-ACP synthase II [Chitinivibrionales bacterium]
MSKRIVVTGLGVVSPVGNNVESFWHALRTGTSGLDRITAFDTTDYPSKVAGEVKGIDFTAFVEPKEVKRTDRNILLAMAAADEAMRHSKLDLSAVDRTRCGVIIGSGIGGIATLEAEHTKLLNRGPGRVSPFLIPMMIPDMSSGLVSMKYGLKGPNYCCVSACASSAHAIGDALLVMRNDMMDVAVVGGCEATITPISFAGFCSMKALSTRNDAPAKASCPFDVKRDGFVMAEGAAIIVLETLEHARARNAAIYAELVGYGATGDAHHLSAPAPEGEGARRAMQMAVRSAGIEPSAIDYINAHGTSTQLNDKYESQAIMAAFGDHARSVAISSTKSMTGHLLGASGATELVATTLAINHGLIPPTINYDDPDPECPLTYTPNTAVEKNITYAMSNSFGFGGHNACLVLKKYGSPENGGE